MIDERRDNTAEDSWHGLPAKIVGKSAVRAAFIATHDTTKFLSYFGYSKLDQVPAIQRGVWWPADEDGDWKDGNDTNANDIYDNGEDAGDDIGLDGIRPGDLNYTGPDTDGTECNHKPDFDRNTGKAEPDFASTDVGESDMLGLTSFCMFPHPQHTGAAQLKNDKNVYDTLASNKLLSFFGSPSNLYAAFGSGTFRLAQGRTERLSMANVNSYDDLTGLNNAAANHPAPSLYVKLKIIESVYSNDYRFSQTGEGVFEKRTNLKTFTVEQNYPNPFNPNTKISYTLQSKDKVRLSVYDIMGKEVSVLVNDVQSEGLHEVTFSADRLSSGIYFYKLQTTRATITKKMVLIK